MKAPLSLITIVLMACSDSVPVNSSSILQEPTNDQKTDTIIFRRYKHDLFKASNGRLGFKTVDNSDPTKPEDRFLTLINTDTLNSEQGKELSEVVDSASFVHIGDLYYKDKNRIYYHIQMMDGGSFFIVWEADPNSFKVLDSSYYGKDKRNVFCRGSLIEQADAKSFRVISQPDKRVYSWTAKDKNHRYDGADVVNTEVNK